MAVALNNIPQKTTAFSPFGGFASLAWQQHRRGLARLGGYVALLAIIVHLVKLPFPVEVFSLIPIAVYLSYFGIASVGMTSDASTSESHYPKHLLRLPISTYALVGWPILFGAVGSAVISLTVFWAIWTPMNLDVTSFLVAIVLLILFAMHVQALLWMPVSAQSIRLWIFGLTWCVLPSLAYTGVVVNLEVTPSLGWSAFATIFALTCGVAYAAVSLARRGDVIDYPWKNHIVSRRRVSDTSRVPFASALAAEVWYLWRRQERTWIVITGMVLVVTVPLMLIPEIPVVLKWQCVLCLLCSTLALSIHGKSWATDRSLNSFLMTRPMTTSTHIAALVWSAGLSALARWGLGLLALCLVVAYLAQGTDVTDALETLLDCAISPRAWAVVIICILAYCPLMWKLQIDDLHRGFSKTKWRVHGFTCYEVGIAYGMLLLMSASPHVFHQTLSALPLLFVSLAILKIIAASIVLPILVRSRLVQTRTLQTLGIAWLAIGVGLSLLLTFLLPRPFSSPLICASLAFLALPIVRFSLAPLTLADNRHRD